MASATATETRWDSPPDRRRGRWSSPDQRGRAREQFPRPVLPSPPAGHDGERDVPGRGEEA